MDRLFANHLDPLALLDRQRHGDWGNVTERDRKLNEVGIRDSNALLSVYRVGAGEPVIVLTEANHLFAQIMVLDRWPSEGEALRAKEQSMDYMRRAAASAAKFPLGMFVLTPGAIDAFAASSELPMPFLVRHASGDWGELSPDDRAANEQALPAGDRILSAYRTRLGAKLWVITETDRECTAILLPEEY